MAKRPEDQPKSNMFEAFRAFSSRESRANILDKVKNGGLFPLGIEPDPKFEISYSQPAQALRIIDRQNNMCITALYNAYDQQRDDFVDMVFFRPIDAPAGMGQGVMIHYAFADGTQSFGVPEPYKSKADLFLKGQDGKSDLLTYDEDAIAMRYAEALVEFHFKGRDKNGVQFIKCTHQDEYEHFFNPDEPRKSGRSGYDD